MAYLSTHWPLILQIQTSIQGLITANKLSGLATGNVLAEVVPIYRSIVAGKTPPLPAIILSPMAEVENAQEGTIIEDDLFYPVLVEFLMANNQDVAANPDTFLSWRKIVAKQFRHQYLTLTDPAADFWDVQVEYTPPADFDLWKNPGLLAGALILKPRIWESRGN